MTILEIGISFPTSKATKQDKAKAVDDDDKIEAPFEFDVNMPFMEV
jgi:hypothetical protein